MTKKIQKKTPSTNLLFFVIKEMILLISILYLLSPIKADSIEPAQCYYPDVDLYDDYIDSTEEPSVYMFDSVETLRGVRVWEKTPEEDVIVGVEIKDYFFTTLYQANTSNGCVSYDVSHTGPGDVFYVALTCLTPNTICNLTISILATSCDYDCDYRMCTNTSCSGSCSMCVGQCISESVCDFATEAPTPTPSESPSEAENPDDEPSGENGPSIDMTDGEKAGMAVGVVAGIGGLSALAWFYRRPIPGKKEINM